MNFIVVQPNIPENFELFTVRLHEQGVTTLGIGDTPYDELSERIRNHLEEYYYVTSLEDYNEMFKAVAFLSFKYGKIDRLESFDEYWLELDASLRKDFNIFGLKTEDMEAIKLKSNMKKIFREYKIPVAEGSVFSDRKEAERIIKKLDYPVVVKPDSGVGASHTYKLENQGDMDAFFEVKPEGITFIMEEFISGDVMTFDGLTNRKGDIVFSSSLEYGETPLDLASGSVDNYFIVPQKPKDDLRKLGEKIVQAFHIKERFFHIEFFRLESGGLIALEINFRPAGGPSLDLVNYAYSMDVYEAYANLVSGREIHIKEEAEFVSGYVSRQNDRQYRNSHGDILNRYNDFILETVEVPSSYRSMMGDIGYTLKVADESLFYEISNYILE